MEAYLDPYVRTPEFFENPYPLYQQLQADDPVHWSQEWGAWVVTRYDDVMAVLRDPEGFSNEGRQKRLLDPYPPEAQERLQPLVKHYQIGGLINSDPPDHTRLRLLVGKAFTPRVVEHMRAQVQELVDGMIDDVQGAGSMDIIRDLAYPIPAIVIAMMLGVPEGDRDQFKVWSDHINTFLGMGYPQVAIAEQAQGSIYEMKDYLRGLLDERKRDPREDLLTELAKAEEDGDRLSEAELLATCHTLLVAGHETTTNLIGNGMLALFRHPDQLRMLKDDPALIGGAVEEMLRYDGAIHSVKRVAKRTSDFGGKQIQEGQLLLLMLGAANRDSRAFSDADDFIITRSPRETRHIAFGYGIHFCIGAPLARLEAPIVINTLLERLPDLQLAEAGVAWNENMSVRGLKSLPVVF